ncbi:hypothetical protein HZ326_31390 [Fusarium oxysporum f. sp. albedinis]|nr:hypothetical protein HZ326_31390 [Fusarium oxysporum f. sp. albedinis]
MGDTENVLGEQRGRSGAGVNRVPRCDGSGHPTARSSGLHGVCIRTGGRCPSSTGHMRSAWQAIMEVRRRSGRTVDVVITGDFNRQRCGEGTIFRWQDRARPIRSLTL